MGGAADVPLNYVYSPADCAGQGSPEKCPAAVYGYLECTSPINRNAVDVLIGPSYSGPDVLSTRHASVWQRRG